LVFPCQEDFAFHSSSSRGPSNTCMVWMSHQGSPANAYRFCIHLQNERRTVTCEIRTNM
jgi:hypothetical protein